MTPRPPKSEPDADLAKYAPGVHSPTPATDLLSRQSVVDLQVIKDVRLTERALAGDFASQVEWLHRFGGPEWQKAL
jgi:hypothetical protein